MDNIQDIEYDVIAKELWQCRKQLDIVQGECTKLRLESRELQAKLVEVLALDELRKKELEVLEWKHKFLQELHISKVEG